MTPRAPDDGLEPVKQIHVNARVKGQGHSYQVVHGTQSVVHHHYYAETHERPLDLADLRLWIARMTADYKALVKVGSAPLGRRQAAGYAKQLGALRDELDAAAGRRSGRDQLQGLLAAGAAQYLRKAKQLPEEPLPESMMLDLAVFALWPVVQAPGLPVGWQDQLAQLTSPRLATLVSQARQAGERGHPVASDVFGRVLADKPFAHGILALLEDLGDPRGSGACLTPIALAQEFSTPPQKAGGKAVLIWMLGGAAVGGTSAAAALELAEKVWEWLHDESRGTSVPLPQIGTNVDSDGHPSSHRGGGRLSHDLKPGTESGAGGFLDDLLS
ncbi:hypothetical protein ACTMUQ_29980 [Streptomyces sp. SD11]|uniref:hypothetical protein n=1 Tax=Streptomyces sp. SD11 TaxID=3452209 RepID=UPI003F88BFF7